MLQRNLKKQMKLPISPDLLARLAKVTDSGEEVAATVSDTEGPLRTGRIPFHERILKFEHHKFGSLISARQVRADCTGGWVFNLVSVAELV